jgi:NAD(P)-dependent dehydrogenase (short-subunit alcohol dehydrogenase family)
MARTALVSGSASGIGAATVERLRRDGCQVLTLDRRGDDTDVVADLATAEGRAAAVAGARSACGGRLDVVVCCAGVGTAPPPVMAAINYLGTFELLDGLFDLLVAGEAAAAVVISSSTIGYRSVERHHEVIDRIEASPDDPLGAITEEADGLETYINSKIGVAHGARLRAGPWGRAGVRLNVVVPGMTDTPLLAKVGPDADQIAARRPVEPVPLGRIGRPDELAAAISFLASPDASYVHGAVLYVDGGQAAAIDHRRI